MGYRLCQIPSSHRRRDGRRHNHTRLLHGPHKLIQIVNEVNEMGSEPEAL